MPPPASSRKASSRSTAPAKRRSTSTPSNRPAAEAGPLEGRRGLGSTARVGDELDAGADRAGVGPLQRDLAAVVGEERFAAAEDNREDHEAELVEQVVGDQALDELGR